MKLKVKSSNNFYIEVGSDINLITECGNLNIYNANFKLIICLDNPKISFEVENIEEDKTVISISGFHYDFNRWNNISFVCE